MPLDDAIDLETRQEEGRWFPLPERTGGWFFGIYTAAVADKYSRALDRAMEHWRRENGKTTKKKNGMYKDLIPSKIMGEIIARCMTGCTVTKIRGVEFEGEVLDSTPANIRLVLSVRENRQHCQDILGDPEAFGVEDDEPYAAETVEESVGNSSGDSIETFSGPVSHLETES